MHRNAVGGNNGKRKKMVGWYDPGQLLNTGIQVLVSQVLGSRADYRLIESFSGPQPVYEYDDGQECWLDYVADLGDGWNSTCAVADLLATESLTVRDSSGHVLQLPRGRLLLLGGDQVYPVASRDNYEERMVVPYTSALPSSDSPHPAVFAIPGNHDWYDGLISFTRLFCQPRWIGGWRTQQRRSYFALKLPHNWWLWALDYQLESDIDQPQREYFEGVAAQMPENARVILASAEPDWIYGNIYHAKYKKNIAFLQTDIIEQRAHAKLKVAIAGDLHHYRRHEASDGSGVQLITSGGGGAFLLGTCGPRVDSVLVGKPEKKYDLKAEYPDQKTSERLLLRNLLFPFLNPKFGVLPGVLYLVIAWIYRVPVLREYELLLHRGDPATTAHAILRAVLSSPFGFGVLLLVIIGFVSFTDTHSRPYKYIAGTLHALANLGALFLISAAASQASRGFFGFPAESIRYFLMTAILILVGGYIAGSVIMGSYLYVSLRLFRRHSQEAFSALRIADYKHFIRLHIDSAGTLTMYPIALDKVPKHWTRADPKQTRWLPANAAFEPRLIEPPINVVDSGEGNFGSS